MFPEASGVYIAQREQNLFIVKVKGVYPTLQLGKKAIDLGAYLSGGKTKEVPQEVLDNMELFHSDWTFHPLSFIDFSVFSKIDFNPDGTKLYLSEEDILSIRGKYYRMCQQGVSPTKIIRAICFEFKCSSEQIVNLINDFDAQSLYID